MPTSPPSPSKPTHWQHYDLWKRVCDALYASPDHFSTPTTIEGLRATDIFTLNTTLAATIEESVVKTLNLLRPVWDPNNEYQTYAFVRQPQTFPDVILRETDNGQNILMGIELKGWYLLAKESEPTYRFTVTKAACSPWDLLVVVPWVLSNVLAGSPVLHRPYVQLAEYCAQKRNYYWQHERKSSTNTGISIPEGVKPYPLKSDPISDKPASDSGGNFGRLARYGIMDQYLEDMHNTLIHGVRSADWLAFFKSHSD